MSVQPHADHAATPGAVAHRALRRGLNERISSLNHSFGVHERETIDVMCECVRGNCDARITMTVAAYERLRRFPTHFCVKEGHEIAAGERILSEASDYVVIEARGRGGLHAVGTDPRGSHRRRSEVGG
jgi:hypothetical protein